MKHKPLARQLTAQFFRGNIPMFALAVFAALTGGTLNLIVTWLMQQLIDAASGLPGALPLRQLAWITGGFILLCAALMLLKYGFNSNWDVLFIDDCRRNIIVIPIIVDVIGYFLMTIPYLFWDYDSKKQNMVMEVLKRRAEVTEKEAEKELAERRKQ